MGKRVIAVSALLWLCYSGHGIANPPREAAERFELGGYVAPSVVSLGGEDASGDVVKIDSGASFALGGLFMVRLHELIALQTEVVFMRKGSDTEIDGMYRSSFHLDYIQVPLLVRLDVPLEHRIRPYVYGGPGYSWLLGARSVASDGTASDLNNIRGTDIGVLAGAGAAVPFSWGVLSFEVRYDHGLVSIDDSGDGDEVETRALSLLLGYRFGVGGQWRRRAR